MSLSAHAGTLQATQKAAVEGEPRAQYDMAIRYLKDDGVEKSSAGAIQWLKKANEQGYSSAQYKLGVLYRDGRKVDTDMDQAIEYFTLATDQGSPIAQYALGDIYQQGNGVAQETAATNEDVQRKAEMCGVFSGYVSQYKEKVSDCSVNLCDIYKRSLARYEKKQKSYCG